MTELKSIEFWESICSYTTEISCNDKSAEYIHLRLSSESINITNQPIQNAQTIYLNNLSSDFKDIREKIWLMGGEINWKKVYKNNNNVLNYPIPLYSFEKHSFESSINLNNIFNLLSYSQNNPNNKEEFYYAPIWKQLLIPDILLEQVIKSTFVVFIDQNIKSTIWNALIFQLQENGHTVIKIEKGNQFKVINQNHLVINTFEEDSFRDLFNFFQLNLIHPNISIFGWQYRNESPFENFLSICNYFKQYQHLTGKFYYLTESCFSLTGNESVISENNTIGLSNILNQEFSNIVTSQIDISSSSNENKTVSTLFKVMLSSIREKQIVIRDSNIWKMDFEEINLTAKRVPLVKGETYLITGGLGNVGFLISKYLIENFHAKLILVGKTNIESDFKDLNDSFKLERLNHLLNMSSNVIYVCADISNLNDFESKLNYAEWQLGEISGVINASGITDISRLFIPILETKEQDLVLHHNSKLSGIKNIFSMSKKRKLNFVWVTSSLSSQLGGLAYGAYATANASMDNYIINECPSNWTVVNLDALDLSEEGIKSIESIGPQALIRIFEKTVNNPHSRQIITSITDLKQRIEKSDFIINRNKNNKKSVVLPVVNVKNIKNELIQLWKTFFEKEEIQLDENFFQLGGTSIDAVTFVVKINELFNTKFTYIDLYEFSTIELLLKEIELVKLTI